MTLLENIRNQKIEELKTLNANIQAILDECTPKAEQLAQDIADLTEAIDNGEAPIDKEEQLAQDIADLNEAIDNGEVPIDKEEIQE